MWVAATLAGLAAMVWFAIPRIERALMYRPAPTYATPLEAGLEGVEEVCLKTPDGERIVAWYGAARPDHPTLLYFHGNAGTLLDRADRIAAYLGEGRGIFMMSYRGYSGSTGKPSEAKNVADAKLAYEALRARGVSASDIIVYGESIGTGIAVQVAADKEVAGVVLDAPYTSIVEVAEQYYPYLPNKLVMRDRYETAQKHLPKLTVPVLVIHGEDDQVIPVEMGRRIAEAAPAGGEIVTFPGAGHTDHAQFGSFAAVNGWIDRLRAGRVGGRAA